MTFAGCEVLRISLNLLKAKRMKDDADTTYRDIKNKKKGSNGYNSDDDGRWSDSVGILVLLLSQCNFRNGIFTQSCKKLMVIVYVA